ncbi:hypothetical protein ACOBV9_06135 [Pseudoalteromonas espejiana]
MQGSYEMTCANSNYSSAGSYDDFLEALAFKESSGNLGSIGGANNTYLGLYQMGEASLVDAGFIENDGNPFNNNYTSYVWTTDSGVSTYQEFLASEQAQNTAIQNYHERLMTYNKDYMDFVGQTIDGIIVTETGIIAASHLVGYTRVQNWLDNGTNYHDGNGVYLTNYMGNFGNYCPPKPGKLTNSPPPTGGNDPGTTDPICIDLDGNGLSFISLESSNVYFNISKNGIHNKVSWLAPNDGFLVLSTLKSGVVTSIEDLVGDSETRGMDALKAIDSNSDGIIDKQDEQFTKLAIWRDLSSDGVSQLNELQPLSFYGIEKLDLDYLDHKVEIKGLAI